MNIISCENLTKTYGSAAVPVHALQDVSLAFEQGSFTAITGKSGSGKSTLLHTTSFRCCAAAASVLCSRAITLSAS